MNQDEKFEEARLRFEAWLQHRDRTRVRKAFVAIIIFAFVLGMAASAAMAHEAPSGWSYPTNCCSNEDCARVPAKLIKEEAGGFLIEIPVGSHPMVMHWPVRAHLSYQDPRIQESPDGLHHLCVSKQTIERGGVRSGGNIICVFISFGIG